MQQKVLIIGAKGMLGRALISSFSGWTILAWDKDEIDITDFKTTRLKIQDSRPNVIINAAAFTDVDACENKQAFAHLLNGEAPGNLALIANDIGATLIQYSTAYVFDGKNKNGYAESDEPMPMSVYAHSKLQGERGSAMAVKHYILRLDRLFGRQGQGKESFVDKMLDAAKINETLTVIDDEYGCPTYAPDMAVRTRQIVDSGLPYGVYHTVNEGWCSWYEWAEEVFKIKGNGVELRRAKAADFVRKAARPQYGILRNTKLPVIRSWQEALREYLN